MKKQIFILMLSIMAIFANVSKSYGQKATKQSDPIPLSCTNDPLNPIAGKEYIYTVAATPAGGTYTWWATKDPVFYDASASYAASLAARLTTTTGLANASAQYGVPTLETAAASGKEVRITWSTDLLAKTEFQATPNVNATLAAPSPTFVAVHYAPLTGSCSDNFKVFEINPKNGFTVDILNLNPTTKAASGTGQAIYAYDPTQCFANVTSAKYNAGKMDYLYGVNILYYEVVAANFSGSWTPSFKISNLDTKQTATIEWAYTNAFASPVVVTSNTGNGTYVSPSAASTDVTDTSNGVSIYVRVTVTNNSFEGLNDQSLALAVDGKNSSNQLDVVNSTCTDPGATPDFIDVANQTIAKRPIVVEGTTGLTPNTGIIPKNP